MAIPSYEQTNLSFEDDRRNLIISNDLSTGNIIFTGETHNISPKVLGTLVAEEAASSTQDVPRVRVYEVDAEGNEVRTLLRRKNAAFIFCEQSSSEAASRIFVTDPSNDDATRSANLLAAVLTYLNDLFTETQATTSTILQFGPSDTLNAERDETNTTILFDNGKEHAVNAIVANVNGLGFIDVVDSRNQELHFQNVRPANVTITGSTIGSSATAVAQALNALFSVDAIVPTSPVITNPVNTDGEDINMTITAGVDPIGDGILGRGTLNEARFFSNETIDAPGEYYEVLVRGHGRIGIGLGSIANNDDGDMQTAGSGSLNTHEGFWYSQWFYDYGSYIAPWTTYGSNSQLSYGPGWNGATTKQFRYNGSVQSAIETSNGEAGVLLRVGIDADGRVAVWYYDINRSNTWILVSRSATPLVEGQYFLSMKFQADAQLMATPKRIAVDPVGPTLSYRYIESPDGTYHWPLFATEEEANYVDSQNGGSGTSHTHTYVDDLTGTTWYMPDTGGYEDIEAGSSATNDALIDDLLNGPIPYTGIVTDDDGNYAPSAFAGSDITLEEGSAVNIQVTPAGATWATNVTGLPAGLAYDGYSMIQGNLPEVGSDTTYTITVTRANAYGSSIGTFDITATDVPPVSTNDTNWNKAIDFSGSSERAQQANSSPLYTPIKMGGTANQVALPVVGTNTVDSGYPWATSCVFKIDGNSSNQHIWNLGEGAGDNDDNIYLRVDANQRLFFGWGRGNEINEVLIHTLSSAWWYGIYVGFNGARYGAAGSTASRLDSIFDIRLMSSIDSFGSMSEMSELGTGWTHGASSTGARMDREFNGYMTIGGRGSNRNFHGKVASFVSTTLPVGSAMPGDAEIEEMITDPKGWLYDYKAGNPYRRSGDTTNQSNFVVGSLNATAATQIWLMGDGIQDSYSNMIRNQVWSGDQNYTKMNILSMQSNDIQTVNIPGLT